MVFLPNVALTSFVNSDIVIENKLIEVAPNISTVPDVSGAGERAEKERVPKECDS